MNTPSDHFASRLLAWFDQSGRHNLPWQHPRAPYRVWLAEIMLQQTQVKTAIPYFQRFVEVFPTLPDLARASLDEVLAQWSGLGYYARARNLHASARLCVELHGGELPRDFDALIAVFKSMNDLLEKSGLFQEQGVSAEAAEDNKESKLAQVIKSKYAKQ